MFLEDYYTRYIDLFQNEYVLKQVSGKTVNELIELFKNDKIISLDTKNNPIYEYGCENKRYIITFYRNMEEKEEKYGGTHKVIGIVENFNPMGQTAIKDDNGDLWLIDSRLIAVMKPTNKFDKMKEKEI